MNKAKKEESDLEIRKEMERRVLQDRPIRFDWVIKRLLYRKANFNVLNGFAVLAGLLAILLLVPSCTTEDEVPDLSDEGTNGWIYKIMADYYLWNEDMPGKGNLNFSQSPDKFFDLHHIKTATFIMPGFYMSCLALLLPRPDWNGGTGLLPLVVRLRM